MSKSTVRVDVLPPHRRAENNAAVARVAKLWRVIDPKEALSGCPEVEGSYACYRDIGMQMTSPPSGILDNSQPKGSVANFRALATLATLSSDTYPEGGEPC